MERGIKLLGASNNIPEKTILQKIGLQKRTITVDYKVEGEDYSQSLEVKARSIKGAFEEAKKQLRIK